MATIIAAVVIAEMLKGQHPIMRGIVLPSVPPLLPRGLLPTTTTGRAMRRGGAGLNNACTGSLEPRPQPQHGLAVLLEGLLALVHDAGVDHRGDGRGGQ